MMTKAFLRRERLYVGGASKHTCRIGGKYDQPDDGLRIEMGPVTGAWWDVPLPACPDCGGVLVWAEAGYVPGTRACVNCGSLFSVQTVQEPEPVRVPAVPAGPTVFDYECDNGHRWSMTADEAEATGWCCPTCGEYAV